jgi:hypothetical protein
MRCPYCNANNAAQATFCTYCGRSLPRSAQQTSPTAAPRQQVPARPNQQPQQGYQQPGYYSPQTGTQQRPTNQPTTQAGRTTGQPSPQTAKGSVTDVISARVRTKVTAPEPVMPPAPEPPVDFPPRTFPQYEKLLTSEGVKAYTIIGSEEANGKRKIVRVAFPRSTGWQQAATLLKVLQEQQQDKKFNTIIVQGYIQQGPEKAGFNNGQLQFEREAILGGQKSSRYIVETGDSFAIDTARFVLYN